MPHGRPSLERQGYVRIKLQQDTHVSWVELKASLKLKSDDTLALSYTAIHVGNLLAHYVSHYVYIQKLKRLHKQCIVPLSNY